MEIDNSKSGISIIVCNYNAKISDIFFTLSSCIKQVNVDFEVIFADDGSKDNHEKEILEFFKRHCFKKYQMLCHPANKGTVQNIYDALKNASYPYIKTIGSGDAFYNEKSCSDVISFMIENKLDYCFGDGVYFFGDKEFNLNQPAILDCYNKETLDKDKIIKNLMIYNDFILGAALFAKKKTLLKYFDLMNEKIVYEEDAIITTSIADGASIMRFPGYCVFYEYGSGISTSPNIEFVKKLYKDKLELFKYIETNYPNKYSKKALKLAMVEGNSKKDKIKRILICPSKLSFKLKANKATKIQKEKADFAFLKSCREDM